jgi:hypothetical protein
MPEFRVYPNSTRITAQLPARQGIRTIPIPPDYRPIQTLMFHNLNIRFLQATKPGFQCWSNRKGAANARPKK